jgi:excisionase family DNA binding protein
MVFRADRDGSLELMATQAPPEPTTALLTLSEVAELAKVSRSTVRREIGRGELRAVHIGRQLRVRPDDYRRWLEGGTE